VSCTVAVEATGAFRGILLHQLVVEGCVLVLLVFGGDQGSSIIALCGGASPSGWEVLAVCSGSSRQSIIGGPVLFTGFGDGSLHPLSLCFACCTA
jgi:hypothetical protein